MNRRNIAYIARYNDRKYFPLVDNKLTTKMIAAEFDLAVPKLMATITAQHEVERIEEMLDGITKFVAKPAQGSGGKGILVVHDRDGEYFVKANGERIDLQELKRHLTNIISGLHSIGGRNDLAFIEEMVEIDDMFADYSFEGVPDIRLIVFQGIPIMGMLRLATRASDGKANLHQGAIGVGLDITTGEAIQAVQFNSIVESHPDTGARLENIKVPNWPALLRLASLCYDVTELGYLGCDIVIDKRYGPLILELNARPGLSIQIANNAGLVTRLRQIEAIPARRLRRMRIDNRVEYAMREFGNNKAVES